MNYEKNLKYFKSTDTHYYIGLPIFIAGVVFFALAYIFWTYLFPFQDIISLILIILGALIAFVPLSRRSSEKDIDEAISQMTENYEKKMAETLGISAALTRECPPTLVGTYTFENDTLVRRGKTDRKFRSDHYTAAALLFTKNGICIAEKKFSLIEENTEETLHEFLYADIDEITTRTHEHRFENGDVAKISELVILKNKEPIFSLPVTSHAALDRVLDSANLHMNRLKTRKF